MSLSDLYQEVIRDHSRNPSNHSIPGTYDTCQTSHNPLCGDTITIYISFDGEVISDIKFQGSGCAISQASASLMTEAVKGLSKQAVTDLFEAVHNMATEGTSDGSLGKLEALASVSNYPTRVKCATISWHLLKEILDGRPN